MDGAASSEVRGLTNGDIPEVAAMFWRMFKPAGAPFSPSIADYFSQLYLNPANDTNIASQVHIRGDGVLTGFIGALPLKMVLADTALQAAICGPLMVEDHLHDPLAGARLLRAFLAGPQDISLSETANETSRIMWNRMRGKTLPGYSLEWIRLLRPAAFMAEMAAFPARFLHYCPLLTGPFDALAQRAMKTPVPEMPQGVDDSGADPAMLASLIPSWLKSYELHPDWEPSSLRKILTCAHSKSTYGTMHGRVVINSRSGLPLGAYLFHGDRGRTARVLQIIASKGHEGTVVDSLLHYASSIGSVAVRARTQPRLMEAMMIRRGMFFQRSSTVVHARDPRVIAAFSKGEAFFNGLAGEAWNRLNGDDFP